MGIFDVFKNAFANQEFDDRSAKASHILFKEGGVARADEVKAQIESGELSFAEAARQFSSCPSGQRGGSLGNFSPGQMVPAFDAVVFAEDTQIGAISTVTTQFGTHLVKVEARSV